MEKILASIQYFFVDLVTDLVRWPFWWYSKGLILVTGWIFHSISNYSRSLALWVWIKNIFVPMFGARDIQSRLISFFVRLVQIIARSFMLLIFSILMIIALAAYMIFPVFCVYGLINQLIL
ncbi:MAG: hypothetical protein ABH826_00015 [Patescibacteria group bacterium]|nr:hypothetical protein [Patescibacteria group bacterium]